MKKRQISRPLILIITVLTALVLLTPLKGARQTEAAEALTAEDIIDQMAEKAGQIKDLRGVIITGVRKSTFEFKQRFCFRIETTYTLGTGTLKGIHLLNEEGYWLWTSQSDDISRDSLLRVFPSSFSNSALMMFSLIPRKLTQDAGELNLLGQEKINGKNAYVLETLREKGKVYYNRLKFWIDTTNLSPLKMETYRDEELKTETIAKEFKEIVPNFWLPVKCEVRWFPGAFPTTSTLENIEVNKGIPDDRFALRLSESTLISDRGILSVEDYEERLKSDPDNINLLYTLGLTYLYSERNHEKATRELEKVVELMPDSKAGYSALGQAYSRANLYEEAASLYRKAIDRFPDYIYFRTQLASVYERKGEHDLAIEEHRKAIELNPEWSHHYERLASLYGRLGRKEDAIEVAKMLLEKAPEEADTYGAVARIYRSMKSYDEAIDYCKKAVDFAAKGKARFYGMMAVAPDQLKFQYQLELAEVYKQAGKTEEAEKEYKKIMTESNCGWLIRRTQDSLLKLHSESGAYEKIMECCSEILKSTEDAREWEQVARRLIRYYEKEGKLDELVATVQKKIEEKPDASGLYTLLGEIYSRQRNYEQAIAQYKKAIELSPKQANLYANLAGRYEAAKMYEKAIESYIKAIELKPEWPHLYVYAQLASLCHRLEGKEEALKAAEMLLEKAPENANVYSAVAQIYRNLKMYDEAIEYYQKAVELAAQGKARYWGMMRLAPGELKFQYQLELAEVYKEAGKNEEAIKEYEEIITQSKTEWFVNRAQDELSRLYRDTGGLEEILREHEKKLTETERESLSLYKSLGEAYRKKEQYDKALEMYQKALQIASDDLALRFALAGLYQRKGMTKEALTEYDRLMQMAPGSKEAKRAQTEVEKLRAR